MEFLVPSTTQRKGKTSRQEQRQGEGKGEERGGSCTSLRFRVFKIFCIFAISVFGGAYTGERAFGNGQGVQGGDPRETAEAVTGQLYGRHSYATEKIEQTKEHHSEDREQKEGHRKGPYKLASMDGANEDGASNPEAETRRKSDPPEERIGTTTGRGKEASCGRVNDGGGRRGKQRRRTRTIGVILGGRGSQEAVEGGFEWTSTGSSATAGVAVPSNIGTRKDEDERGATADEGTNATAIYRGVAEAGAIGCTTECTGDRRCGCRRWSIYDRYKDDASTYEWSWRSYFPSWTRRTRGDLCTKDAQTAWKLTIWTRKRESRLVQETRQRRPQDASRSGDQGEQGCSEGHRTRRQITRVETHPENEHTGSAGGFGDVLRSWYRFSRTPYQDRLAAFLCGILVSTLTFLTCVLLIIFRHRERVQVSMLIGGHRFFKRNRCRSQHRIRRKGIFFLLLLTTQHGGASGMGWPDEAHHTFQESDVSSYMTRPERSWDPPAIAYQATQVDIDTTMEEAEEAQSHSEDGHSKASYYRMAFVFEINNEPFSLKAVWEDYWALHKQVANACNIDVDQLIEIHSVTSLPLDLQEQDVQALLPLKASDFIHGSGFVIVLMDIEFHEGGGLFRVPTNRAARMAPGFITRIGLLQLMGVTEYCEAQDDTCLVWHNNAIWKIQDIKIRKVSSGDYLRCALPPCSEKDCQMSTRQHAVSLRISKPHPAVDESSLMQLATQDISFDIHIYSYGSDYLLLETSEIGTEALIDQMWQEWGIPHDAARTFHEMPYPPRELIAVTGIVLLRETFNDLALRVFESDVFVMTQLIVHQIEPYGTRSLKYVQWARQRSSRTQLLVLLRILEICEAEMGLECISSLNHQSWPSDDINIRRLEDGDFFLVEITTNMKNANAIWEEIRRQEHLETTRRLFQTEHDCDTSEALGNAEDATRDLAVSHGHDEECNTQTVDREATDLSSMLQFGGVFHRDPMQGLRPPGNPLDSERSSNSHSSHLDPRKDGFGLVISVEDEPEDDKAGGNEKNHGISIHLPITMDKVLKLFQPWCEATLRFDFPDSCELTPIGKQYLYDCNAGWCESISSLHIYTDGSHSIRREVATGAFVVFGIQSTIHGVERHFLRWQGGRVITDELDPHYSGALSISAMEAEASALLWAHAWLVQSCIMLPTTFYFDSVLAGFTADGHFNCSPQWHQGQKLRELAQFVNTLRKFTPTCYEHVKAHSGQPCNEIADSLARLCSNLSIHGIQKAPKWNDLFLRGEEALSWACWMIRSAMEPDAFPTATSQGHSWTFKQQVGMEGIENLEHRSWTETSEIQLKVVAATYNVRTLAERHDHGTDDGEHWRAALLREQFEARGLHAIGLQETRANQKVTLVSQIFIRFISGNVDRSGHLGCELWLSTVSPLGYHKNVPIYFQKGQCTVLHSDERILAVHARPKAISFVFIVCHAPHEGHPDYFKDDWWGSLKSIVMKYKRLGRLLLMGDFNARLHQTILPHIGDRLSDLPTDNGRRFACFLEDTSLWLPSTFSEWHDGIDYTWTHARGLKSRIDYIAIDVDSALYPHCSYVDTSIQVPQLSRDHELVVLQLSCWVSKHGGLSNQRHHYDWDAMNTKEGRAQLQGIMKGLPLPAWDTDVHAHWQIMEDYIHKQLAEHFPGQRKNTRRSVFNDEVWLLLAKRAQVKERFDSWDEAWNLQVTTMTITSWRHDLPLHAVRHFQKYHCVALNLLRTFILKEFREVSQQLKRNVKQSKADFIERQIHQANRGGKNDIFQALRPLRIGSTFRKRGPPTLPGLGDAQDDIQTDELWLRHCADMEAAVPTNTHKLVQRARRDSARRSSKCTQFATCDLPTLRELEGSFRRIKMNKSGGNDNLR